MKATYDTEADALSVDLVPGGLRQRTLKAAPGILLHFDKDGHLIELELIGASEHIPRAQLERLESPAEWLTLEEAEKESGLKRQTLKVLIHAGKLKGEKRGNIWFVTTAALYNYLDNRGPSGGPPTSRKAKKARKEQRARRKEPTGAEKN